MPQWNKSWHSFAASNVRTIGLLVLFESIYLNQNDAKIEPCQYNKKLHFFSLFLFVRLFKTNANLKYIFANFSKLETEDDMRENEALEHHATFVMTTLDEAISNIDNYNYVIDHLHRTGATHQRFIDFSSENFGVSARCIKMVPAESWIFLSDVVYYISYVPDVGKCCFFTDRFY